MRQVPLAIAPIVLLGACLGGRARVDEWTPVKATDEVEVWSQNRILRLHAATVLLDSITGIPYALPLSCDSCRVGIPRAQVDSAFVGHQTRYATRRTANPDPGLDDTSTQDGWVGGFQSTIGVGTGSATLECSACTHAGNMGGSTLTIQLAQRVSPHLRVAATTDAWWHSQDDWERGVWSLNAMLFYYPARLRSGFFFGGGPSYSMMFGSVTDSTALQRHGWGVSAEMGYELRPGAKVSLTPFAEYSRAWVGDIYYPLGSGIPWARDWKHQVVSVGLGVTFRDLRRE